MSKTVSAREAQSQLGAMIKWTIENNEGIIVERRGKPSAAIISYEAYENMNRLLQLEQKLMALEKLRKIRQRVQERAEGLTEAEIYQMAGFGENAAANLLEKEGEPIMPAK